MPLPAPPLTWVDMPGVGEHDGFVSLHELDSAHQTRIVHRKLEEMGYPYGLVTVYDNRRAMTSRRFRWAPHALVVRPEKGMMGGSTLIPHGKEHGIVLFVGDWNPNSILHLTPTREFMSDRHRAAREFMRNSPRPLVPYNRLDTA